MVFYVVTMDCVQINHDHKLINAYPYEKDQRNSSHPPTRIK